MSQLENTSSGHSPDNYCLLKIIAKKYQKGNVVIWLISLSRTLVYAFISLQEIRFLKYLLLAIQYSASSVSEI